MHSCCADPADWVQLGPVSSVCVEFFTPAIRLHLGNVNSLCGSLGTVFHLPSRNCSNEARHIAFHPSLPAIRHSSQFSLWPQRSVCIHRHNAVGQGCPLPSEASLHKPPLIYLENCSFQDFMFCLPAAVTRCYVFVCLPLLKRILSQRIQRKVIWSWFADLANMECITFLEFREENQLCNANQIYFQLDFYTK